MNTQSRLGIWISRPEHLEKIDLVLSKYDNLDDVFLISDDAIYSDKYSVISSYYVSFNKIMIAFLDIEDFIYNKIHLRSNNISLFCNKSDILAAKLDKKFINNVRIIEL